MPVRCLWEDHAQARLEQLDAAPPAPFPGSVTAFFPAYNDAATIGTLVEYTDAVLSRVAPDHEIVVVNDGSQDETAVVLEEVKRRVPCLRIITHEPNQGYGAALRSGFAAATKEFLFYTDGDAQYDPTELIDLLPHGPDADLVNGYKRRRGDGMLRAMLGIGYRTIAGWMFGLRVRDVDCDFRLIRVSLLQSLPLKSPRGSICAELVYQLQQSGARIVEVPVHHYNRVHGRSQVMVPWRLAASLLMLLRLWWQLRVVPGWQVARTRPWGQLSLAILCGDLSQLLAGLTSLVGPGL